MGLKARSTHKHDSRRYHNPEARLACFMCHFQGGLRDCGFCLLKYMTTKQAQYAADRQDPRWQKKRLEIMQRDNFSCCICGDNGSTLNVHHLYYVKDRSPWDYPNWTLETLCRGCHSDVHDPDYNYGFKQTQLEIGLDLALGGRSPRNNKALWALLSGIASAALRMPEEEAFTKIAEFARGMEKKKRKESAK